MRRLDFSPSALRIPIAVGIRIPVWAAIRNRVAVIFAIFLPVRVAIRVRIAVDFSVRVPVSLAVRIGRRDDSSSDLQRFALFANRWVGDW